MKEVIIANSRNFLSFSLSLPLFNLIHEVSFFHFKLNHLYTQFDFSFDRYLLMEFCVWNFRAPPNITHRPRPRQVVSNEIVYFLSLSSYILFFHLRWIKRTQSICFKAWIYNLTAHMQPVRTIEINPSSVCTKKQLLEM